MFFPAQIFWHVYPIIPWLRIIPFCPHVNLYFIIIHGFCTLLSPWHDNPLFPSALYEYYCSN